MSGRIKVTVGLVELENKIAANVLRSDSKGLPSTETSKRTSSTYIHSLS